MVNNHEPWTMNGHVYFDTVSRPENMVIFSVRNLGELRHIEEKQWESSAPISWSTGWRFLVIFCPLLFHQNITMDYKDLDSVLSVCKMTWQHSDSFICSVWYPEVSFLIGETKMFDVYLITQLNNSFFLLASSQWVVSTWKAMYVTS